MSRRDQAHRLPPKRWDQAVFVMCLFIILVVVVLALPDLLKTRP